jgi:hypothetical protein
VAIQLTREVRHLNLRLIEVQVGRTYPHIKQHGRVFLPGAHRLSAKRTVSRRLPCPRREAVRRFVDWPNRYCGAFQILFSYPARPWRLTKSQHDRNATRLLRTFHRPATAISKPCGSPTLLRELSALPLIRVREEQGALTLRIIPPTLFEYRTLTRACLRQHSFPLSLAINRSPVRKINGERARSNLPSTGYEEEA